ncbi:FAD-dependent oxidoreductase [Nocardioides sp. GY 10127]|uniref:NAD(P)/FAD-dependent oxidoreductase n=1 Tax=Nocardioides sp. GY 10127 TaxID=2569762 RepID=UPI0010A8D5BD|nr:FAD-dependent oxidoreductase [Nocardioides sp. GY 10127]TIC84147.1 NAD(P)/FAD-dependent oxidoreductase [Nocardioides sp. GY 10127]
MTLDSTPHGDRSHDSRTRYDYLVLGGGMAADAAAQALREQDPDGTIGLLSEEATEPFPRPALSKKLWTDPDFTEDGAWLGTADAARADVLLSHRVVGVDTDARTVVCADGQTFSYGRLLVATGGHPRTVEGLPEGDRVLYYRSLADYRRLRALVDGDDAGVRPHVAVVGGGYIGSEIAAALVGEGCRVTLVHPDDVLGEKKYPADLAAAYDAMFREHGVDVHAGARVTSGDAEADGVRLTLSDGAVLEADAAVVGLGIEPATSFLSGSVKLADDGSILVDAQLRTSAPDVWACGDVVTYPDAVLGERRVEHVDNATSMGAVAGRNLAGAGEEYRHTPMFYSDLFDVGYEAVGTLDASLETVTETTEDGRIVYYLDDDEVVGVLCWNEFGLTDAAVDLLARHARPADPTALIGSPKGS